MKILIIHNKYGKFSGEETVVESQISLLRANGHDVTTYFRSSDEIKEMPFGKIKAFFTGMYNSTSIREIKIILDEEKFDLVHIHNLYPLISPAILPLIKSRGVPILMTVHNYRLVCPNGLFFVNGEICEKCAGKRKELNCVTNNCEGSLFKSSGYAIRNFWVRMKRYYLDNIDIFLCLTEFQKSKLIENGFPSERCDVLSNSYNQDIEELKYDIDQRNYVAFAGRISPEKGIPHLLKAAGKLKHIQFKLAGRMRDDYFNELDIPDNVSFLGMLDSQKLKDFYSNARLLIFTSTCYEGFGMVLLEGMAHKLPIIAPNMAANPEIVKEFKSGFLYEPGNSDSLANTINKLWDDKELCKEFAEFNFETVQKKYSRKSYIKRLENIYQEILLKTV